MTIALSITALFREGTSGNANVYLTTYTVMITPRPDMLLLSLLLARPWKLSRIVRLEPVCVDGVSSFGTSSCSDPAIGIFRSVVVACIRPLHRESSRECLLDSIAGGSTLDS